MALYPTFQTILDGAVHANDRGGELIAEYTVGGRKRPAMLTVNRLVDGRRVRFSTHEVDGKREARSIAATLNARPWNF